MFTVKHKHPAQVEYIFQTERVYYDSRQDGDGIKPTVLFDEMTGREHAIDIGIVYVMNQSGSTVAKYDLGTGPFSFPRAGTPNSLPPTAEPDQANAA